MWVEVSGSPTVVIVVVRTVVSSQCETAALPALPHTRRSCADDRMRQGWRAIHVVTSKTSFTQSRSGSQTLRNEVALDQATIPALCSPARRRPRRYGTGEQADGKLPDYGPGRQAGICAAIWACGCTLRCSQGRWYLKGTAPLSEHQPGGSQCRGGGRNPFKGTAIRHQSAAVASGRCARPTGGSHTTRCAGSVVTAPTGRKVVGGARLR